MLIGSNLGLVLWLTQKLCTLFGVQGLAAVALIGAVLNLAFTSLTSTLGLGEDQTGLAVAALAGAGAAVIYRLLAGRRTA